MIDNKSLDGRVSASVLIKGLKLLLAKTAQQVLAAVLFHSVFYYLAALAVRTVYLDKDFAHSIILNQITAFFIPSYFLNHYPIIYLIISN
jgi:hypothetical protein